MYDGCGGLATDTPPLVIAFLLVAACAGVAALAVFNGAVGLRLVKDGQLPGLGQFAVFCLLFVVAFVSVGALIYGLVRLLS